MVTDGLKNIQASSSGFISVRSPEKL